MHTPLPPGLSGTSPERHGIAASYTPHPPVSDEMVLPDGTVRPGWQSFVSMLDELGTMELQRRWHDARRMIHENGVTHNVYGDPQGLDRPWTLDLVPLLMQSSEWQKLCEGLIQRATLLDCLLADLYGPARTVRDGLLPPELLWTNPGFLRACHGAAPPQNRWLHLYAADLGRSEEGQYEVLSDRTQAPSGAGYSLENRIVLSRTLPGAFHQCNVERLAPFFAALRDTLASFAPANRDDPRIVLLTPGPFNETYFEHSFLANYLGYALVQGNDLTVRDGKVYLKTVGGLQRVDVILRRVDDHFCDPLELYAGSYLGVPGLLEAVRQGHVVVANALGTGVLQAPGFLPFLPELCRRLLGEELKLPSVPTWWCGQAFELQFVLDNLPELVIKSAYPTQGEDPVFGADLTRKEQEALAQKIKAHPEKYVGQRQVMACTVPALIGDQLQPRRFVVRPYLAVSGDSYRVMNGALTRITQSEDSLLVSLQRGGGSKDTWILSDGVVNQMTLLTLQNRHMPFSRGVGDLPSRLADDLFWLGRYAERVGSQVRLARAAFHHLVEESRGRASRSGRTLAAALEGDSPHNTASLQEFIESAMGKGEDDGLRGAVAQVLRLARVLRERLTGDAWRIAQQLDEKVLSYGLNSEEPIAGWPDLLNSMVSLIAAFLGLADDVMTGSRSWRFLDIGRRLERSMFISGLLASTAAHPGSEPGLLESVLEVSESAFPYRRRYRMQLQVHAIVDLLVADRTNPRAVAFQLVRIGEHLAELPRDPVRPNSDRDRELLEALLRSIQAVNLLELCEPSPDGSRRALLSFLHEVGERTGEIADAVAQVYFSHAAVPRALGVLGKEAGA